MKLQLSEVWDFIALMQDHQADWVINLHAGDVVSESLTFEQVLEMRTDETYEQELLPFTIL